ncbi:MAG: hypothetical protein HND59_10605 [Pseudomonadota bacterium]|nr:MAG: hypothetical protein HND59_10605 [Pseudomonadota bacterium]
MGLAESESVGDAGGGAPTSIVAERLIWPPAPVQVSVNVLSAVSGPTDALPDVFFEPDQAPDAVQPEALLVDHVSEEFAPKATVAGLALRVSVGVAGTTTVTVMDSLVVPPSPVQVKV